MAWLVDDGRLEESDWVFRRFPRLPSFFVPRDAITGRLTVTNAALQYDSDGMSVYSEQLVLTNGATAGDLYAPERQGLTRVAVGHIRVSGGGVVVDPDEGDEDPRRGQSHCLIRTPLANPDKRAWALIRLEVRKALEVFDEEHGRWEPIG